MTPPKRVLTAARILLNRTQAQLADDAGLAVRTVTNVERGTAGFEGVQKLVQHFKEKGIEFIKPAGDHGWGVFIRGFTPTYEEEKLDLLNSKRIDKL
jgi:transcriptional regulator with XRE-family HTH domain